MCSEKPISFVLLLVFVLTFSSSCTNVKKTAPESSQSSVSSATSESPVPEGAFDSAKDFEYLNMTVEEADKLFGEPEDKTEIPGTGADSDATFMYRRYQDAVCKFRKDNTSIKLVFIRISTPSYNPVRGIKIGDSLDSVLSKFPHEEISSFQGAIRNTITPLYGTVENGQSYGCIEEFIGFASGPEKVVSYYDQEFGVHFRIDTNNCVMSIIISNNSPRTDTIRPITPTTTPAIFDGQKDFTQWDMTIQEADALFGEPLEVTDSIATIEGQDYHYMHRTYKDAKCNFKTGPTDSKKPETTLNHMEVYSPGFAPVRSIQVGDSIESVIAKFPYVKHDPYRDDFGFKIALFYGTMENSKSFGCIELYKDDFGGPMLIIRFNDDENNEINFIIGANNCISGITISKGR